MTDPSGVTGFAVGKAMSAAAGFFGGLSVSFFWQPAKLHKHGRLAAGAIIGGIAVFASTSLGGVIARQLGVDINDPDNALGIGYVIGAMSVGVLSLLANFFDKREGQDLVDVVQEVRSIGKSKQPAKAPAKRRPKK